jgi:hypothetical protein
MCMLPVIAKTVLVNYIKQYFCGMTLTYCITTVCQHAFREMLFCPRCVLTVLTSSGGGWVHLSSLTAISSLLHIDKV